MIIILGGISMKKKYEKPVLDTKAYAQFENVFTNCSQKKGGINCRIVNDKDNGTWVEVSSF
jgi:hypothetical protein